MISHHGSPFCVHEFPYSIVQLHRDQFFRGYTLVTYKEHRAELYQLPRRARIDFYEEMVKVAAALNGLFHPDKMNYLLMGNFGAAKGVGGHLHWHLVPRYKHDKFWGQPPFQPHKELILNRREQSELVRKIRKELLRTNV